MPSLASISLPPVSGFVSGTQPKIYNAQPAGTFTSPPQNSPIVSINSRYLVILNLLDSDTRIGDTITYYLYPVPSAGFPTITLHQRVLTGTLLQIYINNMAKHFQTEALNIFASPGTYDIYYEQTNASNTYTVLSQNLRFIVQ